MARAINRFFSPRVQGQFQPQFVEEPFPFQEAFLVGAGQQKRIEDQLLRAEALEDVQVRPIAEDVAAKEEILSGLRSEMDEILGRRGGDAGVAAQDLSKLIGRTKPKFAELSANLAVFEEAEKRKLKFDDPLTRQGDIFTQPTIDPETGRPRVFRAADIVETPDFSRFVKDNYGDLKAIKTQGPLRPTGVEGVFESVTTTELTPADIRAHAKSVSIDFLETPEGEDFAIDRMQRGISQNQIIQEAEDFIFNNLKDKAQKDKDVQFVGSPKEKEAPSDRYIGLGIGSNISANVASDNNTSRGVISRTPGEAIEGEFGEERGPDVEEQLTLSSENSFSLLQNTKAANNYTLLISPQLMWDLEDFGAPLPNVGEEDFELDVVEDYLVADKDITVSGVEYKAGQIIPDEAVLGADLATIRSLPDPPSVSRKFFAVGRIKGKEEVDGEEQTVERSVAVPYKSVKKTIKAATATDGVGGFEINEKDFFGEEALELLTIKGSGNFTIEELKGAGWSDEQIARLKSIQ